MRFLSMIKDCNIDLYKKLRWLKLSMQFLQQHLLYFSTQIIIAQLFQNLKFRNIMQKEKIKTYQSKKSKTHNINNEPNSPIFKPLMQEIDTLKLQLKSMKNRKQLTKTSQLKTLLTSNSANNLSYQSHAPIFTDVSANKNNASSQIQHMEFIQLKYNSKDKLLKLQIQFNKLKRLLQRQQIKDSFVQINQILKLINHFNKQQQDIIYRYLNEQEDECNEQQKNLSNYVVKYKQQLLSNKKLQKQIEKLTVELQQLKKHNAQRQQIQKPLQKRQQQFIILSHNNTTLQEEINNIKQKLNSYEHNMIMAQQKCKTYEMALQKKQRQLLMQEADIDYLRIQTQKTRNQKRELESLYEQFSKKHKQMIKKFQFQLEQLTNQKNQVKHQLNLRRQQYQQILQLNQQKNYLIKQIQQMRQDLTQKNAEYSQLKSRFYDEQKKGMELQSQIYKLTAQNDKLSRNVDYLKRQVSNLGRQLQQFCQNNKKQRIEDNQHQQKQKNRNRALILSQLTALVKQHRFSCPGE